MDRPRILIVEDQPLVVEGVKAVLESRYDVIGVAKDGAELLTAIASHCSDVVLFDLGLPAEPGLRAIRPWTERYPAIPLIVMSAISIPSVAEEAISRGAAAFVSKMAAPSELRRALEVVLAGGVYRSAPSPAIDTDRVKGGLALLSPAQVKVVHLIGRGLTNRQIATEMGVSDRTIHSHRSSVRRRLRFRTDFELIRFSILAVAGDRSRAEAVDQRTELSRAH